MMIVKIFIHNREARNDRLLCVHNWECQRKSTTRMRERRNLRPANLADKLRRVRHALGLSQSQLVRLLDPDEIMHYGRVSEYELGKREPALWILLAYARVAGIHLEYLVDDNLSLPTDLPGDVVYPQTKPNHRRK